MPRWGYKPGYRRNLPHLQPLGVALFVTFRLAGSIPKHVVKTYVAQKEWLKQEWERLQKQAGAHLSPEVAAQQQQWEAFYRQWFGKFETALHQAKSGPQWLGEEPIAKLLTESLHYRNGRVYELEAYCVMPNHVHTVFTPYVPKDWVFQDRWRWEPEDDAVLSTIMQSLKGYSAYQCNRVLGRRGQFWEHESYDRYVRDDEEFDRIINYVLNNPVKAGLVAERNDWPWSYCRQPEDVPQPV